MAVSTRVADRLFNWKFSAAADAMKKEILATMVANAEPEDLPYTLDERDIISSLAKTYGNVGYFDGDAAVLIRAAVAWVIRQPLDCDASWTPSDAETSVTDHRQ